MLLRLIPSATAAVPAPPTILFTLPTPAAASASAVAGPINPYGQHNLIAPPALVAHAQACSNANLPISTLMAGESSSWISTVVKEVTFLPTIGEIQILLVDGSGVVMPLAGTGAGKVLDQVRDHVLDSAKPVVAFPQEIQRPGVFSGLFGSLLGGAKIMQHPSHVSVYSKETTPRQHRRLARSLLVDCYRRFVLSGLKALLPPTYVLFTAQSLLQGQTKAIEKSQSELRVLLSIAGLPPTPPASPVLPFKPSHSRRHAQNGSVSSLDLSPPSSPRVAIASLPQTAAEIAFPSACALPSHLRQTYAGHLASLRDTQLAISKLDKLVRKHEREERRARWEESVDYVVRQKHRASASLKASPVVKVSSGLRFGFSAADLEVEAELEVEPFPVDMGTPPLSPTASWSSASSSSDESDEESEDSLFEGEAVAVYADAMKSYFGHSTLSSKTHSAAPGTAPLVGLF